MQEKARVVALAHAESVDCSRREHSKELAKARGELALSQAALISAKESFTIEKLRLKEAQNKESKRNQEVRKEERKALQDLASVVEAKHAKDLAQLKQDLDASRENAIEAATKHSQQLDDAESSHREEWSRRNNTWQGKHDDQLKDISELSTGGRSSNSRARIA